MKIPEFFHSENNSIRDWNDVGVSKSWQKLFSCSHHCLNHRVLWVENMSNATVTLGEVRVTVCFALLWCCAIHLLFQGADVRNHALGPFRRSLCPRRFTQSCEVQVPGVSDHRATRTAKRVDLSATDYLLKWGRFHVRHEEVHHCSSAFNEPENERASKLVHFLVLVPAG